MKHGELVQVLRECNDCICEKHCPYYEERNNPLKCMTKIVGDAADAIEELKSQLPKWIPVAEQLPKGADKSGEICENVWLFFDDGNVYPGWMNGITEKVYYLDNYNGSLMTAPKSRVKMWQPRPEPPKEETDGRIHQA